MTIGKILNIKGKDLYCRLLNTSDETLHSPLLVFLHEGLGCTEQWKDFPAALSERCNLPALVYDRHGYGKSAGKTEPNHARYMHTEAFEVLPELLRQFGITQKVILVGHSDGGTIALLFASRFQARTLAVISECDHVICEEITVQGVRRVMDAYQNGKLRQLLTTYHGDKTDDLFYGWTSLWLSDKAPGWSIVEELPGIRAPLLAIQGTKDHFGSVEQLILKLRHCSGPVQVNHLAGCGHVPHHENRETVTKLMQEFIQDVL